MRTMLLILTVLSSTAHAQPALKLVRRPPNYFAAHNDMVQRAFLKFSTVQAPQVDRLQTLRERDRLLIFGVNDTQVGYGVVLFGAVTVLAAHAPAPLRALFDGPVHLGPAVFDQGGIGAGIGGRFL
jgi:hypothetical protein